MPSHSLNPDLYPAGHGVTTDPQGARHNARPVPQPMHLASIEKEANVKAAIEYVMLSQSLPYAEAAEIVHKDGEAGFLAKRDAVANEINAAQNAPQTLDQLRPGGVPQDVNPTLSQREAAILGKDNFMGNPAYPAEPALTPDPRLTRDQSARPLRPGETVVDVKATPIKPNIVATGGKK